MYYSHQTPILIESQWNLNKITNLSTGEFIRILIESQWNLNNFFGVEEPLKVTHINRITVEFKFMLCLLSNIRKSDINRITVEFKC